MARKKFRNDDTAAAIWLRVDSEAATCAILAIAAIVLPLIISLTGVDIFRLPKELAFRATAILVMVVGVFAITKPRVAWDALWRARQETALALLIIAWTTITTMTSTNRGLSWESLITVVCSAAIFLATRLTASRVPILVFDLFLVGACVNALVVTLQEYGIWNPFNFAEVEHHMQSTALIGNPNDVGAYLVVIAVAAIVGAAVATRYRRWLYVAIGVILAIGLFATGTRTALIAYIGGLVAFSLTRSRREAFVLLGCVVIISVLVITPQTRVGKTVERLWTGATQKQYNVLFSERLPPFLCALEMARAHPVVGVGPGCFKYNYMDYRVALASKYPMEWTRGQPMNFGEVHNDHLQVLAETGLPGYGLFLASVLTILGLENVFRKHTPKNRSETELIEHALGRNLRLPIAVVFVLLALAQFPLQLAAPRFVFLTLGALSLGWDDQNKS